MNMRGGSDDAGQRRSRRPARRRAAGAVLLLLGLVLLAAVVPAARAHKRGRGDDDDDRAEDITTDAGCRRQRNKRRGCPPGSFQTSKRAPCQLCSPGTYSCGGHCERSCKSCPRGTTTPGFGAQGPSQCSVSTTKLGGGLEPEAIFDPATGKVSDAFVAQFNAAFNLLQNFTAGVEQVPAVDILLSLGSEERRRRRRRGRSLQAAALDSSAVPVAPGATLELVVAVTQLGQPVNVSLTVVVRVVRRTPGVTDPACFTNVPGDAPPPFCGQLVVGAVNVTTPADGGEASVTLPPIEGADGDEFFFSAYAFAPASLLPPAGQFITSAPLFVVVVGPPSTGVLELVLTTPPSAQGTTTGPSDPFDANFVVSAALTFNGGVPPVAGDAGAAYEFAVCRVDGGGVGGVCGDGQSPIDDDTYTGNLTGGLSGVVAIFLRNAPQNGDNVTFAVAVRVFTASNGTLEARADVLFLPNKFALAVAGPSGGFFSGPDDSKVNVSLQLLRNGNPASAGPNSAGVAAVEACAYGATGSGPPPFSACPGASGADLFGGSVALVGGKAHVEITLKSPSEAGYSFGYVWFVGASLPLVSSDLAAVGSATSTFFSTSERRRLRLLHRHRALLGNLNPAAAAAAAVRDGYSGYSEDPPAAAAAAVAAAAAADAGGPVGEDAWRARRVEPPGASAAAAADVSGDGDGYDDDDDGQGTNSGAGLTRTFTRVLLHDAAAGDGDGAASQRRRLQAWRDEVGGIARAAARRRLLQTANGTTTGNNTACRFVTFTGLFVYLPACKFLSSFGARAVRRDQGGTTNACSSYASTQLAEAAYRAKIGASLPRISERGLYYCDSRAADRNATLKALLKQLDNNRTYILPQQPQGWRALYGLALAEQLGVPLAARNGTACFGFDQVGVSYFNASTNGTTISATAVSPFCTSGGRSTCRVRGFQYVPLTPSQPEDYATLLAFIRDNGGVGAKIALNSDYLNVLRNPAFNPDTSFIPSPFLPQDTTFVHSLSVVGWDFSSNNTNNWNFALLDSNPGILPNRTAAGTGLWRVQIASGFNRGNGLGFFYGGVKYIGSRITP